MIENPAESIARLIPVARFCMFCRVFISGKAIFERVKTLLVIIVYKVRTVSGFLARRADNEHLLLIIR